MAVPQADVVPSDSALYEQLEILRQDLSEMKSRLFYAWRRNRWRHELLHLEHLFVLALLLADEEKQESLALLRAPVSEIIAHFAGEAGGEVITREAAALLSQIDYALRGFSRQVGASAWALDEGS